MEPTKIQTKAKNSNKFCISYGTKAAKVTKNSTVLLLVSIILSIWGDSGITMYIHVHVPSSPLESTNP